MQTIETLFGIKGAAAAVAVRPTVAELPAEAYPAKTEGYVFQPILLKKLLRFFLDHTVARRNLLLIGEPGVGKTSVILEVCARLNIPVFSLSCSGKTRFAHMVGSYELVGGSTRWRDGPLVQAMRHGGVFLANEVTRLDPGEQMTLAEVLDGSATLTIPDTGEVIRARPEFRFIATGNSGGYGDDTGAYAGERVASVAFLDRFQKLVVHHLPAVQEKDLLHRLAPKLPSEVVDGMVKLANEVRQNFVGRGGSLRTILSTRSLVVWALETQAYAGIRGIDDPAREALMDTVLGGAPDDEVQAILEIWDRWVREVA